MSNPTSNFNWQMPQNTDLVTDLPADFEVFGQAVDTRLKALQPGTTLGDLAYSSATANTNTRLPIGTTGQVLSVSGGVPAWTTIAAGGKLLQVVSATTSTDVTVTSATFTDTGLTVSITPTASTSKILVLVSQPVQWYRVNASCGGAIKLLRDATDIYKPHSSDNRGNFFNAVGATSTQFIDCVSFSYLDSPATTSATTYKTQGRPYSTTNSSEAIFQYSSATSSIIAMEIGA